MAADAAKAAVGFLESPLPAPVNRNLYGEKAQPIQTSADFLGTSS